MCLIITIFFNIIILVIFSTERYKHDFLWGMFRRRQRKLRSAMDGTVVEDINIDDAVDMEVDALGGELVGTVDVIIPK